MELLWATYLPEPLFPANTSTLGTTPSTKNSLPKDHRVRPPPARTICGLGQVLSGVSGSRSAAVGKM